MKNDPFASNQRFGSPAAGFPPADKDKTADILIKDKGAPNVMTSRVSMKMGNARTVSRRVSDPYFMRWFEIGCKDKNLITFAWKLKNNYG